MMTNGLKTPLVDGLQRLIANRIEDAQALNGLSLPASIEEVDETGTIVTVNFEVETEFNLPKVQCPVGYPEYIRFPLQKGDKGFCIPASVYMGGMSGLGGGVAGFNQQANLSTLVWLPCGNVDFSPTDDKDKVVMYGPSGVIVRDEDKKTVLTLDSDEFKIALNDQTYLKFDKNGIELTFNGNTIVIDQDGVLIQGETIAIVGNGASGSVVTGDFKVNGDVEINGGPNGITLNGGVAGTAIDGTLFLPHEHTGVTPGGGNSGPVDP